MDIAVLPGDGIGPEVVEAALPVIGKVGLDWNLQFGEVGWQFWLSDGDPVPDATWRLLERTDSCLLGAITSKPAREAESELPIALQGLDRKFLSPVIQLRQRLGLYANVRPVTDMHDGRFNFAVIRENTEGLYAGFDDHGLSNPLWELVKEHPNAAQSGAENSSVTLRLQTRRHRPSAPIRLRIRARTPASAAHPRGQTERAAIQQQFSEEPARDHGRGVPRH